MMCLLFSFDQNWRFSPDSEWLNSPDSNTCLKQHSTYKAWKHYWNFLNQKYWKEKTLWSDGYFAASIEQISQETIEHYIESQG